MPEEVEVEWEVKRLQNNRAGGPSRMRTEDLKGWLAAARIGEKKGKSKKKKGETAKTHKRERRTWGGKWS